MNGGIPLSSKRKDRLGFVSLMVVLVISGITITADTTIDPEIEPPLVTECNDGIDNDLDGGIDADSTGLSGDPECTWAVGVQVYDCPLWNSETIPPNTYEECQGN